MTGINAVVYDIEICKAVLARGEQVMPGVEYCKGWFDHEGMGISCIGAYDYRTERYRVFMKDNLTDFAKFVTEGNPILVTFNGISFDNKVIEACVPTCKFKPDEHDYDVLVEMWRGAGLEPKFAYPTHAGFGLDAAGKTNLGFAKTGEGGKMAPVHFQNGSFGQLLDYCLNDVWLTKRLFDRVVECGGLRDPRSPKQFLPMRSPWTK